MSNRHSPSVMFIAGDPSGDHHAAPLLAALVEQVPGIDAWGIGGPAMEAQGFKPLLPFAPFNRMGFVEVAAHLLFFLRARKFLTIQMRERRPDVLVCVDYPGFNMPMLKIARSMGIPVIWYIAPMVWAWKRKRARTLGRLASHIAVIFPFEIDYFKPFTPHVSYVGNPLIEAMEGSGCVSNGSGESAGSKDPVLAIVPGSRVQELRHLLGPMIGAYRILRREFPSLKAVVSRCPFLPEELYRETIGSDRDGIALSTRALQDLLPTANAALVTSGTATLEVALAGVPMVIAYKTSAITYAIFKKLVKLRFIGLPNIIAESALVPECIQDEVTPLILAEKLSVFLRSPERAASARHELGVLRDLLGSSRPSLAVAKLVRAHLP